MDSTSSFTPQDNDQDKAKKNSTISSIVRKSFRVPVERGEIKAIIDQKAYPVIDISLTGISISCEHERVFDVSKEIKDCELRLSGTSITGLCGKVVHYSCSPEKDWRHGIQWIQLDPTSVDKIKAVVADLKDRLLSAAEDE